MLYNKPVAVLGGGNGAHALAAERCNEIFRHLNPSLYSDREHRICASNICGAPDRKNVTIKSIPPGC